MFFPRLWSALLGVVVVAVACGGGSGDSPTQPVTPTDTTHVAPTVSFSSVTLGAKRVIIAVGDTFNLRPQARDGDRVVNGAKLQFQSTTAVLSVDTVGRAVGVAPGSAFAIVQGRNAAGATVSDTALVLVQAGSASIGTPARSTAADSALTLIGAHLAGATVAVNGTVTAATAQGDSSLSITVPGSAFGACIVPGTAASVTVTQGTKTATLSIPMRGRGKHVSLATGAYTLVSSSIADGCPIELDSAGTYLVMPYRWDTSAGYQRGYSDTVVTRLAVWDPTVPPAFTVAPPNTFKFPSPSAARMVMPSRSPASGPVRAGDVAPIIRADNSCALPTTVGDSIHLATNRDASGAFVGIGGSRGEAWSLTVESARAQIFVDTTTQRLIHQYPQIADSIRLYAAAYDTTVATTLDKMYGDQLPDRDNNGGRVVVLLVANSHSLDDGEAYATGYPRTDCGGIYTAGELFIKQINGWVPGGPYGEPIGALVQTSAHEAGHVYDISRWPAGKTVPWWGIEGMAMFSEVMWVHRDQADPLRANVVSSLGPKLYNYPSVESCGIYGSLQLEVMYKPNGNGYLQGYSVACEFVSYAIQRLVIDRGESMQAAMRTFNHTSISGNYATLGQGYRSILGVSTDDRTFMGQWLVAAYADDYAANPSPLLQNTRISSAQYHTPGCKPGVYCGYFPQIVFSTGTVEDVSLGEPDVFYGEATVGRGTTISVSRQDGTPLPTDRMDVAILRVK